MALGVARYDGDQRVLPLIGAEIIGDRASVEAQSLLRARREARPFDVQLFDGDHLSRRRQRPAK